jgi:hypothetical protein
VAAREIQIEIENRFRPPALLCVLRSFCSESFSSTNAGNLDEARWFSALDTVAQRD